MIQLPTTEEILATARETFKEKFGDEPTVAASAPGRVNIIGEHIDYNDGFVLPIALQYVTVIVGRKRDNSTTANVVTCCESVDGDRQVKFSTKDIVKGEPKWANYVKGVVHNYNEGLGLDYGFDAVINTNVPIGGGLSSSAALEVATLTFLEALLENPKNLEPTAKALLCQKAEHEFAEMPCGLMDQFISVMAKKNNALLIDCRSQAIRQATFVSIEVAVLICNSNVRHELSSSEYPLRRKQCADALALMGLKSYRDANLKHLETPKLKKDDLLRRRARHVITEITRTQNAARCLVDEDFKSLGRLMVQSHESLRDDFEVSCDEIDALVEAANICEGVLGARMTGGGFGGCAVTLVEREYIDEVIKSVGETYTEQTGKVADFYVCTPCEGAKVLTL